MPKGNPGATDGRLEDVPGCSVVLDEERGFREIKDLLFVGETREREVAGGMEFRWKDPVMLLQPLMAGRRAHL